MADSSKNVQQKSEIKEDKKWLRPAGSRSEQAGVGLTERSEEKPRQVCEERAPFRTPKHIFIPEPEDGKHKKTGARNNQTRTGSWYYENEKDLFFGCKYNAIIFM